MEKYYVKESYTSYSLTEGEVKQALHEFIRDKFNFCASVDNIEHYADGSIRVDTVKEQTKEKARV